MTQKLEEKLYAREKKNEIMNLHRWVSKMIVGMCAIFSRTQELTVLPPTNAAWLDLSRFEAQVFQNS